MSSKYVEIKIFSNEIDAEIAKGLLAENGIPSQILKDDCGGMRPHLQLTLGVHLSVSAEDVEAAKRLLKSRKTGQMDSGTIQNWECECGEKLEIQFTSCWSCGYSRY